MHFALIVSQLPRVDESRAHYDTLLSVRASERKKLVRFAAMWAALKTWFHQERFQR